MIFRARAPLRISFAGGGTDLAPYVNERGGLVLNATIDRYAYATLRLREDRVVSVRSLDLSASLDFSVDEPPPFDGNLDLIKGCLRRLQPEWEAASGGVELYLETEAPPGSGLGASSALVVATIGALAEWRRLILDKYEVARLAWEIERRDVGVPGGLQDQYAASFGGFNLIEFRDEHDALVNPLRIEPRVIRELEYNMLLVYTGATRSSGRIITTQIAGLSQHRTPVVEAMDRLKQLTLMAKDALLTGRLDDFAQILDEEWAAKKRTSDAVTTPLIDEMYQEARRLGVVGGKVSGAGGGGYMFLYCPFDCRPAVAERLRRLGGEVVPMAFTPEGMQAWSWQPSPQRVPQR
ncbi:MAG: GHMP kinase [Chloroflexi bacterium]|nr:MAG: GHMP kinase [Chloroflexota bacterium]